MTDTDYQSNGLDAPFTQAVEHEPPLPRDEARAEPVLSARLRIGVMLDDTAVPAWVHALLGDIAASDHLDLSLVVLNGAERRKRTLAQRLRNLRPRTVAAYLFGAYVKIDRKHFAPHQLPDAFAPRDASGLLAEVPRLVARPLQTKFVDRFSESDVEVIRRARLDVLLRFGFRIIKGEILKVARYGVWSFHHGDNDFYRGGPALFWEIHEGNPVSGTVLQILSEELDGGRVIYKSYSSTHRYSLHLNRNAAYWKTATFVPRKLRELAENGERSLETIAPAPQARPRLYRSPTVPQLALYGARCAARAFAAHARCRLTNEQWFVAVARRTGGASEGGASAVPGHGPFSRVPMPADRFYADPCAVTWRGQDFIFFEDYSFRSRRGRISYVAVDASGRLGEVGSALEEPFHLSYPFVFEMDGEHFMIPESRETNSVRLYRATAFPGGWKLEATLLPSTGAVDATLHVQDGTFWLFANIAAAGASTHDELHVFHASSLGGRWRPHRRNPIVSDVRRARPAGRLFLHGSRWIRPAQNNSARYGGSIVLNAVEELSPDSYRERTIEEIGPGWLRGSVATHTLSMTERLVVTDGLRYRLKW